jgi:Ca2+-transporting ATPase
MAQWYRQSADAVQKELNTDAAQGLSSAEAAVRLQQVGPNELIERGGRSPWQILWEQLTATMVLILLAAVVVSAFLQKWQEAAAILAIVLLFALLGFVQEYRAERAMAALKKLAVPNVRVRRDGRVQELPAHDLVPGDIILLEAGNRVPADLRLLESINLRVQEAALTGESEAVEKQVEAIDRADLPLGDRRNMTYMGTTVTYGRGAGVVVATGMQTELGNIAGLLQDVEAEATPLQKRLDYVGKVLALVGVAVAAAIGVAGYLQGESLDEVFLLAVGIAVAVVPEGLPAVVTITLALGARRMLARQALIRKLPAVETLGSVTVICSDKTGTLTENRMTVTILDVAGHRAVVDETLNARGDAKLDTAEHLDTPDSALKLLLVGGALVNDAELQLDYANGSQHYHAIGDPTEGALVIAAARFGLMKQAIDQEMPRVGELPFDSERKRMTTLHRPGHAALLPVAVGEDETIAFTKGSVDGLLDISTQVWDGGRTQPLDEIYRRRIEDANRSLAENGMRVLGVAFRTQRDTAIVEDGLTFIGFTGIIDPPRPEVKAAVATCKAAGIRPVMITGDHPLTALHIAKELGIADAQSRVLTGVELERLSSEELDANVDGVAVFARVSPEHKLRIVEALRRQGQIVAMTGDGVNDAPALKQADIGVAMGITGTDVSKEAADMVLRDDNFSTIVAAVEEGRVIYDNLRKFIKFSIGGNVGKITAMVGGVLAGITTPLLPLQLLWLNLLTDGLLGVGLGVEPAERNVMRRAPVPADAGIFSGGVGGHIVRTGIVIGAVGLSVGLYAYWAGNPGWQTMLFATLAFAQVWQALGIRTGNESLFRAGLFTNLPLLGLAVLVVALQLAAIYLPWLQSFIGTTPLRGQDLLLTFVAGSLVFVAAEIEKIWVRRRLRQAPALQSMASGAD